MPDPSANTRRQRAYRNRRRNAGLVRIEVWAPRELGPEFRRRAARLLEEMQTAARPNPPGTP